MMKNYFFILIAIFSFKFAFAQTLSSAPVLNFTSNTGISTDNRATDGEGGSINISDIDIQIYNISDANGTFATPLSWQGTGFYFAGSYTGLTCENNSGSKGMAIKSVSGSEFDLNQFAYLNWGESASFTNTVKGFRNGIEVASMTFNGYNSVSFTPMTIVLNATFNNVDEVRFYITSGGYLGNQSATNHSINSIKVSTPILGLDDFDLSSKISLYPNPATSEVTIEAKELDNASLEISDINGRKLLTQKLHKTSNRIKIDHFTPGIYLFKINSNEGSSIAKVIKN
ncbi:T9SS type A sorting domain-containing protein [Flavobacterium sp. WC2509]|uniref:T9SS type A sorting domain-containing protein n=1 Tax=Flavobacterium sp. WC2509 TaxID=3461406 RepID=UPI004044242A